MFGPRKVALIEWVEYFVLLFCGDADPVVFDLYPVVFCCAGGTNLHGGGRWVVAENILQEVGVNPAHVQQIELQITGLLGNVDLHGESLLFKDGIIVGADLPQKLIHILALQLQRIIVVLLLDLLRQ